ncbi:MAG: hypothetical protein R3F11_09125 [Verrucomicrobiales bacterium]
MAAALLQRDDVSKARARRAGGRGPRQFPQRDGREDHRAGTARIVVEGVESLGGVDYTVIPDRIEAGTFCMAAMAGGGEVTLKRVDRAGMSPAWRMCSNNAALKSPAARTR